MARYVHHSLELAASTGAGFADRVTGDRSQSSISLCSSGLPASLQFRWLLITLSPQVPRKHWDTHRVEINGLVGKPISLSMAEIVALPSITLPVTLVCAGNRRKEENMLKKSIGFNWGPTGLSTSYWTGVRLRDLLLLAGIKVCA